MHRRHNKAKSCYYNIHTRTRNCILVCIYIYDQDIEVKTTRERACVFGSQCQTYGSHSINVLAVKADKCVSLSSEQHQNINFTFNLTNENQCSGNLSGRVCQLNKLFHTDEHCQSIRKDILFVLVGSCGGAFFSFLFFS